MLKTVKEEGCLQNEDRRLKTKNRRPESLFILQPLKLQRKKHGGISFWSSFCSLRGVFLQNEDPTDFYVL